MRSLSMRALGISAGLILTATIAAQAGGGTVLETVYAPTVYVPTSDSVITLPTSYVATSYTYYPTTYSSYYLPTTYSALTPTYYLAPETYYATTYYRPPGYLFPRRVRTAYTWAPTTYYATPTVYNFAPTSMGIASSALTSTDICVESTAAAPPANTGTAAAGRSKAVRGGAASETGQVLKSSPTNGANEPGLLDVKPPGDDKTDGSKVEIPQNPRPDRDKGDASPPPPPAPGGNAADDPAEILRRQSLKPKPGEAVMRPAQTKPLLHGRVTSGATAAPMPGAKVVLTNPTGIFDRKVIVADATGQFEIRFLPSGDWKVEVEDADGKAQSYGTLTISGGRVTDSDGREWTSLNLNR